VLSRKQNTPKVNGSNDGHGTAEIEGRRTGDWFNAEEGKRRRRGPQSRRSKEKEVSSRQLAQKESSEERFFTAQAGVPQQRDGRKKSACFVQNDGAGLLGVAGEETWSIHRLAEGAWKEDNAVRDMTLSQIIFLTR